MRSRLELLEERDQLREQELLDLREQIKAGLLGLEVEKAASMARIRGFAWILTVFQRSFFYGFLMVLS